jgi:hypothetical protein
VTTAVPPPLRPRRGRRHGGIPVADAGDLRAPARRTRLVRLGLGALIVVALGAAVAVAQDLRTRPNSYFAAGGNNVVVTDLSTSVDPAKYRRLARVLRTLVETNQPVGFVVYSDSGYEMLPPGTRGEELRGMLRFFEPPRGGDAQRTRRQRGFGFLESPWSGTFRGGTRISTGLRAAREALARDGVAGGHVLLVSDIDDSPFDLEALTQEVIRYERAGIELRVVPLFPGEDDRRFFAELVGDDKFVENDELLRNTRLEERRTLVGEFPLVLTVVLGVVVLLLAVNEHICGRLGWRTGAVS